MRTMPAGTRERQAFPSVAFVALAALLVAGQGCAPKRVVRQQGETAAPTAPGPAALGPAIGAEAARGAAAARLAREMVGVAYRSGGSTPAGGFDCSGFTRWVYRLQDVTLPRSAREQFASGRRVGREGVSPGDLVFFARDRRTVSHVGIWVGEGRFVHAPRPGRVVRIESIGDSWWASRYMGARRP